MPFRPNVETQNGHNINDDLRHEPGEALFPGSLHFIALYFVKTYCEHSRNFALFASILEMEFYCAVTWNRLLRHISHIHKWHNYVSQWGKQRQRNFTNYETRQDDFNASKSSFNNFPRFLLWSQSTWNGIKPQPGLWKSRWRSVMSSDIYRWVKLTSNSMA